MACKEQSNKDDYDQYFPWFIKPKFIQDKERRPKSHPNYDPDTLFIPGDEFSNFTTVMQQYWNIK